MRRLVPSWSFLTRLRRPLLFRLAGKEGGEKGRWVTVWCILHLNSGERLCFSLAFHSILTLRASWYAPPDTGASSLRRVAFESLRQNVLRIKIIGQYEFALDFKLSRERSKKTEEVFLVGSRESEGKSKSPQALFLLPAFSFGEAKENADGQLQICTVYQPFERLLETPEASPMRGSCRRRRLMRWTAPRRRKCPHLIRHGLRRATFPS